MKEEKGKRTKGEDSLDLQTGKNFLATPLQKIYVLYVPCLHEAIVAGIGRGDDRRNRTGAHYTA